MGGEEPKAEPTTDISLARAMGVMEGERQIMTESQYKCLELLSREGTRNKTGKIVNILFLKLTASISLSLFIYICVWVCVICNLYVVKYFTLTAPKVSCDWL